MKPNRQSAQSAQSANGQDYRRRIYLSAIEGARFLGITVSRLHQLTTSGQLPAQKSAGGQYRYKLSDLQPLQSTVVKRQPKQTRRVTELALGDTQQQFICGNAMDMKELADNSIHLIMTSPPYFNAKMYSADGIPNDLGNLHDLDDWFDNIKRVWLECFRVLQPGRKIFINIMNLPIRVNKTFRCLNLTGRTIDQMEAIGFVFKRDIIWHKTNGVRAHFGTYPYPGGILINNMHEFILEFDKPAERSGGKYAHLSAEQKELSKLDRDFWLSLKNSDVWQIKPEQSGDGRTHVAPFPYELPYRLIKAYSYVSERVLDPFAGSYVALRAAADLKRNGIGYEINPQIVAEAVGRFKQYQPQIF